MREDVQDALDLAAGMRIRGDVGAHQTASRRDNAVTKKQVMLFLESLDADMTIGELREELEN